MAEDAPNESTTKLIGGLIGDAKTLAIAHIDAVQLEIREELRDLKTSIIYVVATVALFAVGAMLASLAIVEAVWLYTRLPMWASHGVIAALFVVVGLVLLMTKLRGRKDVDGIPETGLQRIQGDAAWMARRVRDAAT